jgi:tetratricopeptide (TPR) repeat protein
MPSDIQLNEGPDNPQKWKESGNKFFKKGQYGEAIRCYVHAIEQDPAFIEAWNNLGLALFRIGKVEEAKECDERVKKLKAARMARPSNDEK